MARKELTFVGTVGRDKGKKYLITEKSAFAIEQWAMRVLMAAIAGGVEFPDGTELQGAAGLASVGFNALAKIKFEEAKPLMDEMMECVEFIPDPSKTHVKRKLFDGDIEEVKTILQLRKEIFNLHVDFFTNAVKSTSGE